MDYHGDFKSARTVWQCNVLIVALRWQAFKQSVCGVPLTLSNSLSFSTSISSPMLTSSFFANCMVGMTMIFVKSQLGKTYWSSFINLFGHMWAEISSCSFSMWQVSKIRLLLTCGALHEKFVSTLVEQLTKLPLAFVGKSVTVIVVDCVGLIVCYKAIQSVWLIQ